VLRRKVQKEGSAAEKAMHAMQDEIYLCPAYMLYFLGWNFSRLAASTAFLVLLHRLKRP
jgi:hypothetical protein